MVVKGAHICVRKSVGMSGVVVEGLNVQKASYYVLDLEKVNVDQVNCVKTILLHASLVTCESGSGNTHFL